MRLTSFVFIAMKNSLQLLSLLVLTCLIGCATEAQGPAKGNATSSKVADRMEIENVVALYFLTLDSFDHDAWMNNFTDDAVLVVVDAGDRFEFQRQQFDKAMRARFQQFKVEKKQRRHVVTNLGFISQTDDKVHLKANGVVFSTQDHAATEVTSTIYLEGWLVKQNNVWRIEKWLVGNDTRKNTRHSLGENNVQPSTSND